MCSPLAHPVAQPAGPPFCAAGRQPAEYSCFSFGNTALQSAGPPFSVIYPNPNITTLTPKRKT